MTEDNNKDKMLEPFVQPTVKELAIAVDRYFGTKLTSDQLTDEIYLRSTAGYEIGVSVRTMASRCVSVLNRKSDSRGQASTDTVTGYFVGTRDFTTKKSTLGKNKVQHVAFLQDNEDNTALSLFTKPNSPTTFKDFDHSLTGKHVTVDMVIKETDRGTFVSPGKVTVLDDVELDVKKIVLNTLEEVAEMPDYSMCAIHAVSRSMWPLRVPTWDQDKYEGEDYPQVMNDNPVFVMYVNDMVPDMKLTTYVQPTHLSNPYITVEDFDLVFTAEADFEYDIYPALSNRDVILIGQKRRTYQRDDDETTFVEMDLNAILETTDPVEIKQDDTFDTGRIERLVIDLLNKTDDDTSMTVERVRTMLAGMLPDYPDDKIQCIINDNVKASKALESVGEKESWF